MNREDIDNLIIQLTAIENYAKDLHYNCYGDDFYGKHLFADRIGDNLSDYIDQLKEVCLLGHGLKTLPSKDYLQGAVKIIPDNISFDVMRTLIVDTLENIENIKGISKGDENLIGAISQDLQNNLGLINIMYGVDKDV